MALVKDKAAFVEALKEFGRLVFIAAVTAALAGAGVLVGLINDPLTFAIVTSVLTSLGKAWDKYVHKSDSTPANGVVPF